MTLLLSVLWQSMATATMSPLVTPLGGGQAGSNAADISGDDFQPVAQTQLTNILHATSAASCVPLLL